MAARQPRLSEQERYAMRTVPPYPVQPPSLQTSTSGKGSIVPLLGMGVATLALLCILVGVLRGANLLFSIIIGLVALRLIILCYTLFRSYQSPSMSSATSDSSFPSNGSYIQPAQNAGFMNAPTSLYAPANNMTNMNSMTYEPTYPVLPTPDPSYIPLEQDELYHLDMSTAGEYILYLPKEGRALVDCEDRFALSPYQGRYALADGDGESFVSAPWARIVALGFVAYEPRRDYPFNAQGDISFFGGREQFAAWMEQRRQLWHTWMRERWVPATNAMRIRHGEALADWEHEMRQGARTTLTGCQFRRRSHADDPSIDIFVTCVGNTAFFLFRRDTQGIWQNVAALPFTSIEEFDVYPTMLTTQPYPVEVERAWGQRREGFVPALPGDCIILATNALAKWILTQVQTEQTAWMLLLNSTDPIAHEQLLRQEIREQRLENDDLTMLVIPVPPVFGNTARA